MWKNKALIAVIAAIISFPVFAADSACDGYNQTDCPDPKVFVEIKHYISGCFFNFSDKQALEVSRLAARGEIDVPALKEAYSTTCSFRKALIVGKESKSGDLSLRVFDEIARYISGCFFNLTDVQAIHIARLAAKNKIDVNAFKTSYSESCDYDVALAVGCAGHNRPRE